MKKTNYILILLFSIFSCNTEEPTQFSDEALNDTFITLEGNTTTFKDILNTYKGKTVFIDIWASWCKDCIVAIPEIKALQNEFKDVVYVFLSLDKSEKSWKRGIKKYNLTGVHYFIQSGWDGVFSNFINLNWIPRYMVINKAGNIELFKAIKAGDDKLIQAIKK
ncbi:TlpA family protein disulfide reductase [Sabulilitoribacter arenilitoris]|uniref:TlpA family protein disulfide reductase n=1 Tax=Wocania arenilitoris TaxID=2044858 RepID=A0AAE3EQN5_9FLAO|nr:TlpA disulfide reductase family protein [Wocania arenilitoris]MCF7568504.1 TlpA family protein disulfide reductase [Wocania arenilitoris]